jgi:hypothetical protein
MESTRTEKLPPPPGIISSIQAGFDVIAARISVILLPLLLDLFIWLGPRLRVDKLFSPLLAEMSTAWYGSGLSAVQAAEAIRMYQETLPRINLLWLLRTYPIGVSMLRMESFLTPLGEPLVLQASALNLILWFLALTLAGWIGGGLYFRSVAGVINVSENTQPVRLVHAVLQTVMLSTLWLILAIVILGPLIMLLTLLFQFSEFLANIAFLFLSLVSMWVIVPLFFWPHGIFLKRQNFITSIISSLQMTRFTLPTSSMFVLTIFLLSMGLNFLWTRPNEDSWMTLVGIFGHAFVSTALLASSFIYYRDMTAWLQNVIDRLKSGTPRQA